MSGHRNRRAARARAAEEARNRVLALGGTPEQAFIAEKQVFNELDRRMQPAARRSAEAFLADHGTNVSAGGAIIGTVVGAVYPPVGAAIIAAAAVVRALAVSEQIEQAEREKARLGFGTIFNGLPGNSLSGAQTAINAQAEIVLKLAKQVQQGVDAGWTQASLAKKVARLEFAKGVLVKLQADLEKSAAVVGSPENIAPTKTPDVEEKRPIIDRAISFWFGDDRSERRNGVVDRFFGWFDRVTKRKKVSPAQSASQTGQLARTRQMVTLPDGREVLL